jgi:hypothetical protein
VPTITSYARRGGHASAFPRGERPRTWALCPLYDLRHCKHLYSRGTMCPSSASNMSLERKRAQGMPDATAAPAASCAKVESTRVATTGTPVERHSLRVGFNGLCSRSPRGAGLDSPRRPANVLARLDPSVGGTGPHDFAVRAGRVRLARPARPSRPAPDTRDDRVAPLLWERDGRTLHLICISGKAKYFSFGDWTRFLKISPSGKSVSATD